MKGNEVYGKLYKVNVGIWYWTFISFTWVMPKVIPFLHKMKFGQVEREEGLESHKKKLEHLQWVVLFLF